MLQWALLPFKRYAQFSGRSRRMEFWSFFLLNFVVMLIIYALVFTVGGGMAAMSQMDPNNPMAVYGALFSGVGILIPLYWLATLVPQIAVTVRRFHDRDMSGWWYLGVFIAMLIPFVGFIAGIAFLVLMFLPGTPGPNRFGPDPKDPANEQVFA